MLSVVVPVYNTSIYLSQCVESLLSQSFRDMEIILVNDGSTDNSPEICDSYARKYDNVKVVHKENGGLISAWVAGTKASSGEFVGYVDSDDYVLEDYFQVLMQPVQEYDCDISICGFTRMNSQKEMVHPAHESINGLYGGRKLEELKRNFYHNVNIQNSRCVKVFRKELIEKNIDQIDCSITLGEDKTITVPCVLDADRIYINNAYFGYCYRMNEESMSHRFNPKMIQNYQSLFNNVIRSFEKRGYMNEYVYHEFVDEYVSVTGIIAFADGTVAERIAFLKQLRELHSADLVLAHKYDNTFSRRVLKGLMQIRAYRTICMMADLKKMIQKESA